jgi:hypothetical protein
MGTHHRTASIGIQWDSTMSSIPLMVQPPPPVQGPLQQAQGAMSLQALINQTKLQEQSLAQQQAMAPIQQQQAQAQLQQQQVAAQQAQQQLKDQQIFNTAFRNANGDWGQTIQNAVQGGASGTFITQAQMARNKMLTDAAALTADQLKNESAKQNALAQSAQRVVDAYDPNDPSAAQATYAKERNNHIASGAYGPNDIPEKMPQISDLQNLALHNKANQDLIKEAQAIQQEQAQAPEQKIASQLKQTQNLGQMLGNAESDVQWQSILKTAKASGAPDEVISQFAPNFSPAEAQRAKQIALTPEQQAGMSQAAADSRYRNILMAQQQGKPVTADDRAFVSAYNKQKELSTVTRFQLQNTPLNPFGNNLTSGVPGNAVATAPGAPSAPAAPTPSGTALSAPAQPKVTGTGPVANAPAGVGGAPPTQGAQAGTGGSWADRVAGAGVNPLLRGRVQAILEYRAADLPTTRGGLNQAIMQAVNTIDPTHDATVYPARNKIVQDYTTGKDSQQINAINTAMGHIDDLGQAITALNNGNIPALNAVANKWGVLTGQTPATTFNTIVHRVGPEIASAYIAGGGGEGERGTTAADFSANASPAQLESNIGITAKLLRSKIGSLENDWQKTYKPTQAQDQFQNRFITPAAQASLNRWAPQQAAGGASGGHVIRIGNARYQYKGSGDTADLKNYTPLQ